MRYAAEIYIAQKSQFHQASPAVYAPSHDVDQQVSISRFLGQALARLVSYVIVECSRSLPGAQVVTLGLL